jgi:hypothetical protein
METIFYVLIYAVSCCCGGCNSLTIDNTHSDFIYSCQPQCNNHWSAITIVYSLDDLLKKKKEELELNKHGIYSSLNKVADPKIIKVTMKKGKVVEQKELNIIPIIKTKTVTVEKTTDETIGYEIK